MKSTRAADYQHTRRPIAGMPKDFPAGSSIGPHTHRRGQLVWATEGVMTVTAAQATWQATWVVSPNRALWIPAGVVHAISMSAPVEMRTLYIEPRVARALGEACKVVLMTGLLRELVLEAVRTPLDDVGHDKRLRKICETLLHDPGRHETLEQWSDVAGASSRTLARLFAGETGMRFVDWRHQARLAAALARLSEGGDVASVARSLGYDSASAFTAMFRRILGKAPRDYFGRMAEDDGVQAGAGTNDAVNAPRRRSRPSPVSTAPTHRSHKRSSGSGY